MNNSDQHTWLKDYDFEPDEDILDRHKCKTCGCIRTKEYLGGKHPIFYYNRSGIMFFDKRPDCLDWNDNTLD